MSIRTFIPGFRWPIPFLVLLAVPLIVRPAGLPSVTRDGVTLTSGAQALTVSLKCPRFVFGTREAGGLSPAAVKGSLARGRALEVSYLPVSLGKAGMLEPRLMVEWSPKERVLRKWATFRLLEAESAVLLKEVVLEELDAKGQGVTVPGSGVQSYPAFLPGFFAGIEFPVAATRVEKERLLLAHRPGWFLEPGQWRESRKAVFGVAPQGAERPAFERYIAAHRPKPFGLHVDYNSWWTSPAPFYTESDILGLMREFEQKLSRPYGVCFDTFCIDMGWSNPRSIWQIDATRFPRGFSTIEQAAHKLGAELGLWISPSAYYHEALDPAWARTNVETSTISSGGQPFQLCCLGGSRYASAFAKQLVDLVTRYHIRQVKLDGYSLECPETTHGHAPGIWSSEALAEGGIAAFLAVRKAAPDVWLETTCFGFNPSPWWLFYVNSVIGTFGDDAPRGRVPAPVYRESYTTARDYYNLQGAARMPVPVVAQEVLGIIHQTDDPFMNDAVITVLRGHAFLPLYLNPRHFNERRWESMAETLKWARRNAPRLEQTVPILPAAWRPPGQVPEFSNSQTMPRQPYGYAHWKDGKGLIAVRNPWILPRRLALRLDESIGADRKVKGLAVVSLYPEPRLYARGAQFGDTLEIPLAPYETLVLACEKGQQTTGLPEASQALAHSLVLGKVTHRLDPLEAGEQGQALGPERVSLGPEGASATVMHLDAEVEIKAPAARFLLLSEDNKPVTAPGTATFRIDGQPVALTTCSSSATGWAASGYTPPGHWLFQGADLSRGTHRLTLNVSGGTNTTNAALSAWIWTTRPGQGKPDYPNALPSPETISLDAQLLLGPDAWRSP